MEIFNFVLTDDMRGHGEQKLNLGVEVKVNNMQSFKKQLNSALELFFHQENKAIQSCSYLHKASAHRQVKTIEFETGELLRLLRTLHTKTEAVFYEDRKMFSEKFDTLISYLQDGQISCELDNIGVMFTDFSEWLKESLSKKIDMCDKLAMIAGRPLKAIVVFSEKGYETHFTKYHLNLEHFSELMHKLLKAEFDAQYVDKYYILERDHFQAMAALDNFENIKIIDFLNASDKVLQTQSRFDHFRKTFLNAQVNAKKIQENLQTVIQNVYLISNKFEELYGVFAAQKAPEMQMKELFAKIIGVVYKLPVKDFLCRKELDFVRFYEFVKTTPLKAEDIQVDRMLFFNLEKLEPVIAERLKSKLINELKIKENCMSGSDVKGQFLIRKNDRGIFDRNCYYTHSLLIYEFIPKRVENVRNKYTLSSGYDKILVDKSTLRFSGKVFSAFFNREISYDIFIEIVYYNINLSNHYSTKAA